MTTHVLMITDKSESMGSLTSDVISGFNGYLDNMAGEDESEFRFTSVLFNTAFNTLCEAVPLADVPRLNTDNYRPNGFTALLDAVRISCLRLEENPELRADDKVLVVIQTDGLENSSRQATFTTVRDLIQRLEATGRWTFLFIGQGPDSWDMGRQMGSSSNIRTNSGAASTRSTYGTMADVSRAYAGGQSSIYLVDMLEEEHRKSGTLADD